MSRPLATRAALALALAAAAALVLAGTVVGQRRREAAAVSPLPSATNTGPAGLAAARAVLLTRGREAPIRHAGLDGGAAGDGAPPGAVVVVAGPAATLEPAEVDGLLGAVARGGTLLFAAGRAPQPALEQRLEARLAPAPGSRLAVPLAPHPLVGEVALPVGEGQVLSTSPAALPIAGSKVAASLVAVTWGAGEVLLLSGPEPLSNERLAQGNALTFLTRLAARGPLVFDERWLSPRAASRPPPAALTALAAQALLAGAALVFARGRRLGAVRPPPAEGGGRTALDYLRALAALYRRAAAEGELTRAAWARARRGLERRAGIPARLPEEEVARRLAARSPAAAAAFERGRRWRSYPPGPAAFVGVIQACADLERAVLGK